MLCLCLNKKLNLFIFPPSVGSIMVLFFVLACRFKSIAIYMRVHEKLKRLSQENFNLVV